MPANRIAAFVAFLICVLALPASTVFGQSLEAELQALRQTVDRQQRELDELRTRLPTPAAEPARLPEIDAANSPPKFAERFDALESQWQAFREAEAKRKANAASSPAPTLKLNGLVNVDSLWFSQTDESRAAVGDVQNATDLRRARIITTGEAFDVLHYALGVDFGLGTPANGRPQLLDAFIGVSDLPYLGTVRAGHVVEPFGLERYSPIRFASFMERALSDTFSPVRNVGVITFDKNEEETITWAYGGFRSTSDNFGDDAGDQEGWAFTGRMTSLPYYDESSAGRSYFHLGAAYSYRQAADGVVRYRSRPEAVGRSDSEVPDKSTPFFADTGTLAAHYAQQFGSECAYVLGPLSIQGEYVLTPVDRIDGANPLLQGGYVYVSYFLTGEHRPYNRATGTFDRVTPFENFFRVRSEHGPIITGLGAWEVLARFSHLDFADQDLNGGALNNFTLGLNWYLTGFHRVKFNYIQSHLRRAPVGESVAHIVGVRLDWDF